MKNNFIFITLIFAVGLFFSSCNSSKKETQETPEILLSDTDNKASCVFMTTDQNGIPAISWVEEKESASPKMFFARWQNDQNKFGDKTEIPIPANTSVHEEGMPKIVFKQDGTLLATYESSTPVPNKKWGVSDLSYIESKDGGQSWTKPESIYRNKHQYSSPNFSGLNRLADGEIGVAWLDNNPDPIIKNRPLMFAKSLKGGGFGDAFR